METAASRLRSRRRRGRRGRVRAPAERRGDRNPFAEGQVFLYPTFQRKIGFFESLAFWSPKTFEDPGVPKGLATTTRSTYDDVPPDREYENLGEGP